MRDINLFKIRFINLNREEKKRTSRKIQDGKFIQIHVFYPCNDRNYGLRLFSINEISKYIVVYQGDLSLSCFSLRNGCLSHIIHFTENSF